jgi:hypothetical protein
MYCSRPVGSALGYRLVSSGTLVRFSRIRFRSSVQYNVLIVFEYCSIVAQLLVHRARKGYVEASLNGLKCSVAFDKEPNGNHEG